MLAATTTPKVPMIFMRKSYASTPLPANTSSTVERRSNAIPRILAARAVRERHLLEGRLLARGLRVEMHQVQHRFRHVTSHPQAEIARPVAGDRIIVRPCAAGQQFDQLLRFLRRIFI